MTVDHAKLIYQRYREYDRRLWESGGSFAATRMYEFAARRWRMVPDELVERAIWG